MIYVEDPNHALPARDSGEGQEWFDIAPGQDPLAVADVLGRPVAIVRLGGRVPEQQEAPDLGFLYGCPPVRQVAPRPAVPPPARGDKTPAETGGRSARKDQVDEPAPRGPIDVPAASARLADGSPTARSVSTPPASARSSTWGRSCQDPINLSIGQPDFDVPETVRQAAIEAIQSRKNGYALTQGMPVLREKLQAQVDRQYGHDDREVFVTSGTSGGADAGHAGAGQSGRRGDRLRPVLRDVRRAGRRWSAARSCYVDTYPDFRIDLDRVADAITPRTKMILFNSPANPTGAVAERGGGPRPGRAGRQAERGAGERRDLPRLLLRPAVRLAGQVQPADAGDRRLQQELRHARLAAGLRPRPVGDHPGDDQAAAVQFRLRAAPVPMGGRRGAWTWT